MALLVKYLYVLGERTLPMRATDVKPVEVRPTEKILFRNDAKTPLGRLTVAGLVAK